MNTNSYFFYLNKQLKRLLIVYNKYYYIYLFVLNKWLETMDDLFNELLSLKKNAYCPYSKFWVTAIATANGKKYYGVNIENSSYPVTICAERVAISNAIADGNKKIDEVHLLTCSKNFGTPCGMCRQFMSEFMKKNNCKVYIYNLKGESKCYEIKDLLLDRFQKKDLLQKRK